MISLLFALLVFLFLINVPIGIALGTATMIIFFIGDYIPISTIPARMFAALDSFPLMAAPFFILAGKLMEHGGISDRIVHFAKGIVGQLKGGLGHVAVVACMIFAALSGSASATTAAIGAILISSMVNAGYDRSFASAVHAAGGTTGIVIPPSVPLVLYGVAAGVSIGDLFLAGIVPGVLIGLSLMLVVYIISRVKNYGVTGQSKFNIIHLFKLLKDSFFALLMPVIIIGGIYGGIFTPTEAAAVAVVYGFVIGRFVYKELQLSKIKTILMESTITSSVILFLIATSSLFGLLLTHERVPQNIASLFIEADMPPIVLLLIIILFLLVIGTFMETIASIVILTPILFPVIQNAHIDPVHFGIIMIVALSIGLVTPPVGINLFVASQIGKVSYENVVRSAVPFLAAMVAILLIIALFPSISIGILQFAN